jgi:hypothetical protein
MRHVHRWIMTVVAILLVYWVISGLIMAIYDVSDSRQSWAREGGGAGARAVSPLPQEDLDPMLAVALRSVRSAASAKPVTALALRMVDGAPLAIVAVGGSAPEQFIFDARSGSKLSELPEGPPDAPGAAGSLFMPTYLPSLHNDIKDWHRGNALGDLGVWLALTTGIGLLLLTLTGLWVYFQMYVRRRSSSRNAVLWR